MKPLILSDSNCHADYVEKGDRMANSYFINHCTCQWHTQEFFLGGEGGSTNSVEDRENGVLGGSSPLVRGSGGSCYLVQEISFHMVKFS